MQTCVCKMQRLKKASQMFLDEKKNCTFLLFAQNIDRGYMYSLEPLHLVPRIYVLNKNKKHNKGL